MREDNDMHMIKKPTGALFTAAALVASLTSTLPAYADTQVKQNADVSTVSQTPSADGPGNDSKVTSAEGLSDELIDKYDPYVSQNDKGTYSLSLPTGKTFPESEVELVEKAIEKTNSEVEKISSSAEATQADDGNLVVQKSHGGFKSHWWGFEVWLDNYAVGKVQKMLAAGAGVSGLAAAIMSWTGVGGGVAGVIAGAFAAAGGIAELCNWSDKGISIKRPHVGPVVCWPR
ncbi:hypothetical protein [Brevibacterium luteolum]|uniref:hypothetical protein n=1 Tax=Brevibacterium luteolum TaxID=199591 RepID=UPI00223AA720|nr:hypothetical protein [Brevibacterium luteolum]MCT1657434.1 hypothetical protein [Brevibacterium luteolum]